MNKEELLDKLLTRLNVENISKSYRDNLRLWKKCYLKPNFSLWTDEVLKIESAFLKKRLAENKLTNCYDVGEQVIDKLFLWKGDLSRLCVDAIAIPATSDIVALDEDLNNLYYYNGMKLRFKCIKAMNGGKLSNGEVLITRSYNVPTDFILHVNYDFSTEESFKKTIINVLDCARVNMVKTVAITFSSDILYWQYAYQVVSEYLEKFGIMFDRIIFVPNEDMGMKLFKKRMTEIYA